ncbi:GTP-binding protein [Desulfosporosinus sp. PR]|uniref:GTP-binding protein n=1 Tax=Candidatus Desulfosporosinus nitrosoreducens TaxID=3401928 RepID=UPI0027ECB9FE|nr:GTP-binding protein [Desulfosporosinus sp. PR]MDQ7093590.1 GTP-binding protein [Desulfosporosinus sp. PR]
MPIPIYVVTGFLDAGKTTALNNLLNKRLLEQREAQDMQILVIQFEHGEAVFRSKYSNCYLINFPKKALDQHPEQISEQIHSCLLERRCDEIWIEWNSVTPFAQLQALILHPALKNKCRMEKVMHMADAKKLEELLRIQGGALPEQIAGCDFLILRNVGSDADYDRLRQLIYNINPGVKIYETKQAEDIYLQVYRQSPVNIMVNVFGGIMAKFSS